MSQDQTGPRGGTFHIGASGEKVYHAPGAHGDLLTDGPGFEVPGGDQDPYANPAEFQPAWNSLELEPNLKGKISEQRVKSVWARHSDIDTLLTGAVGYSDSEISAMRKRSGFKAQYLDDTNSNSFSDAQNYLNLNKHNLARLENGGGGISLKTAEAVLKASHEAADLIVENQDAIAAGTWYRPDRKKAPSWAR